MSNQAEAAVPQKPNNVPIPENQNIQELGEKMQAFLQWLGAIKNFGEMGRGMIVTQEVSPDRLKEKDYGVHYNDKNQLVEIPLKFIVCEHNARLGPLGPLLGNLGAHTAVVLMLMFEYYNPSSFYKPYLDILPTHEELAELLPMTWPAEYWLPLKGTSCFRDSEGIRSQLEESWISHIQPLITAHPELFNVEQQNRAHYIWALANVYSRSYSFAGTAEQPCLVPFADMINHHHEVSADYFYDDSSELFKIFAVQSWKLNEQTFISYGRKPNGLMLQTYGFINPVNEDYRFHIPIAILVSTTKEAILAKYSQSYTDGWSLLPGEFPLLLLAFWRLYHAHDDALTPAVVDKLLIRHEAYSVTNEWLTYNSLIECFQTLIAGFVSTIDEDNKLLEECKDPRFQMIYTYRRQEKEYLYAYLRAFNLLRTSLVSKGLRSTQEILAVISNEFTPVKKEN